MTMPPSPQDDVPRRNPRPIDGADVDAPMPVIGETGIHRPGGELTPRRAAAPVPAGRPGGSTIVTVFGDCRRRGAWRVAPTTSAFSVFGDIELDLREAVVDHETVDLRLYTLFGDLTLIVPPGWEVDVRGVQIFGDQKDKTRRAAPGPDARTVVLSAYGVFGDVTVRTLEIGEEPPKWWKRQKG
ncbi:LiaF domain-containing protein [Mobilicoccus sp.]|uniref:LiaF domain-containing protein n=1 Tax=Mobilicoccus sp. TaxID=2034349 RepID=UPI00289D01D5|nr:LiaF domain-containing protein [Mobilicoccus sp.]